MPDPALTQARPAEPEFHAPQRCRVLLRYFEADEWHQSSDDGWARIDGPWLHLLAGHWQTWPMTNVLCVEWEDVDAPAF